MCSLSIQITHTNFSLESKGHTCSRLFSLFYVPDVWQMMKFAIGISIFLYDGSSSPASLPAINKISTFICISSWGESVKIKHFQFLLGISHALWMLQNQQGTLYMASPSKWFLGKAIRKEDVFISRSTTLWGEHAAWTNRTGFPTEEAVTKPKPTK